MRAGTAAGGRGGFLIGGVEGCEDAAEAGSDGCVEDGLEGGEAGADDADAEFDLGPEHVAVVRPGYVDVVDVGDGPAAEDGGGTGTWGGGGGLLVDNGSDWRNLRLGMHGRGY